MIRFSRRDEDMGESNGNITFSVMNNVIVLGLEGSIYLERHVVDTVGKAQAGGVNDA